MKHKKSTVLKYYSLKHTRPKQKQKKTGVPFVLLKKSGSRKSSGVTRNVYKNYTR